MVVVVLKVMTSSYLLGIAKAVVVLLVGGVVWKKEGVCRRGRMGAREADARPGLCTRRARRDSSVARTSRQMLVYVRGGVRWEGGLDGEGQRERE